MTPFMEKLYQLLTDLPSDQYDVDTVPAVPRTLGEGLHNQVELRALAEQLVCEGNVVLAPFELHLTLTDSTELDGLAFVLACGRARAAVVTDVAGRSARAHVDIAGHDLVDREIAGPEALADLLVTLALDGRAALAHPGR
jgi:hypothetical protein